MTDPDRIDPAGKLLAVADCLHRGKLPAPELNRWLVRAIGAWTMGCPLEQALGLRPSTLAYQRRNDALRDAAALVDNDARRLAAEIAHQDRRRTDSPLSLAIGRAAATGRKLPRSPKQLARIIAKAA